MKWYKRLLYLVPAFIIFVTSFFVFIPKQGISASADDFESIDYQTYADCFAYDYLLYYVDGRPTLGSYYLGNNDFWRVRDFGNPSIAYDGAYPNQLVWSRDCEVNSSRLIDISLDLPRGSFDFLGEVSLGYSATYSRKFNPSSGDFVTLELYYDSVVLPRALRPYITAGNGVYVGFNYNGGTGSIVGPGTPYSNSLRADLFNENGFVGQVDYTLYRSSGNTGYIFQSVLFDSYEGDLFFLNNCVVTLTFEVSSSWAPGDKAVGFTYRSYLIYPSRSLTLNASDYLSTAGIAPFNYDGSIEEVDITSWLGNAAASFFNMEIFPSISLGGIVGVIIAVCVSIWILKFIAGG